MTFVRILACIAVVARGAPAKPEPPRHQPPPEEQPKPPGGDAVVVRHVARPIRLEVLGVEVAGSIDAGTTRAARRLTEQLRALAREARLVTLRGQDKELVDLKLVADCEDEAADCMARIAGELDADHLIYGSIANGGHVHLKLLEATRKIVIEWTGETALDDAAIDRTAKIAFDSLISRSP